MGDNNSFILKMYENYYQTDYTLYVTISKIATTEIYIVENILIEY